MLGRADAESLHLSLDELKSVGLANIRKNLPPILEVAKMNRQSRVGSIAGDIYTPSRLLLHETWIPLAEAIGGELIVAVPVTDGLFFANASDSNAVNVLRQVVRMALVRAPNRLSGQLFKWTKSGWEEFQ